MAKLKLGAIPDDKRGWGNERVAVQCQSCKAISMFDPKRVAQRCEFCGSTALVPYAEVKEALGGFFILDCASFDDALDWAARIPAVHHGAVEVRPVHVDPEA